MATTFPRFRDLPRELRLLIWEAVGDAQLPKRVYLRVLYGQYPTAACDKEPNAMLSTCRDSREIALKQGFVITSVAPIPRPSVYLHYERDLLVHLDHSPRSMQHNRTLRDRLGWLSNVRNFMVPLEALIFQSPRSLVEDLVTTLRVYSHMKVFLVHDFARPPHWLWRFRSSGTDKIHRSFEAKAVREAMGSRAIELRYGITEDHVPVQWRQEAVSQSHTAICRLAVKH